MQSQMQASSRGLLLIADRLLKCFTVAVKFKIANLKSKNLYDKHFHDLSRSTRIDRSQFRSKFADIRPHKKRHQQKPITLRRRVHSKFARRSKRGSERRL